MRFFSLSALFLLSMVPALAAPFTVSSSGTFLGSAPVTFYSAPNGTFSFSFEVDSNPVPTSSGATFFTTVFSNLTYRLNGSIVAVSGNTAFFFTDAGDGGPVIKVTPSFDIDLRTPQIFSLPTSAPSILPGSYAISCGQFVTSAAPSTCTNMIASGSSVSVVAAGVPEPGTVGLGLMGLVGMWAWRRAGYWGRGRERGLGAWGRSRRRRVR